jgi:hypothetical protein
MASERVNFTSSSSQPDRSKTPLTQGKVPHQWLHQAIQPIVAEPETLAS